MPTAPTTQRTCPNCRALVPAGRRRCLSCNLDITKMDGFEAAQAAARQHGFKKTKVESSGPPFWRRPSTLALVVLLLVIAGGIYKFTRPKPVRWTAFPPTGEAAARELLTHISTGEDVQYDQGYELILDSARDPQNKSEKANYRQVFHNMNLYLSGEFNSDWLTRAQLSVSPDDSHLILAHIDTETLHIRVDQATPATQIAKLGSHFGITGIDEFPASEATGFRQMAGIEGGMRMLGAGQGSVDQLNGIIAAYDSGAHESRMQKKVRLLSVVRNPRQENWRAMLQTYPLRDDPVVRHRLQSIATDERYDARDRQIAQQVVDDKVPEELLDGTGIPHTP